MFTVPTQDQASGLKLNIGSGGKPSEGWVNIDSEPMVGADLCFDIGLDTWPFPDNSVSLAKALHVLEHVPRPGPFFHAMKELYRVCQPGARVKVAIPHVWHQIWANDPTHVNPCTPNTFTLFSKSHCEKQAALGPRFQLTPFYKYLGIDFEVSDLTAYLDPNTTKEDDPELEWKVMHLNNIVAHYEFILTAVK